MKFRTYWIQQKIHYREGFLLQFFIVLWNKLRTRKSFKNLLTTIFYKYVPELLEKSSTNQFMSSIFVWVLVGWLVGFACYSCVKIPDKSLSRIHLQHICNISLNNFFFILKSYNSQWYFFNCLLFQLIWQYW